jgi:hypothetical protein
VGDLGIVTSSRDTTIKIWAEDSPTSYSLVHTLVSCSCCCSGHAGVRQQQITLLPYC